MAPTREFTSAQETSLPGGLNDTDLACTLANGTGYPTGPTTQSFVLILDPETASEEHVLCASRSGNNVVITTRGYAGTAAVDHDPGCRVRHGWDPVAAQAVHDHLTETADAHDASAISYAGGTGMSATDVEAALDELATEKQNIASIKTTAVFRTSHTWTVSGEVKVPSGDADVIPGMFVAEGTNQVTKLIAVKHQIGGGTSVTFKMQEGGSDITGFTGISCTTTATHTDPTDDDLVDLAYLAPVVTVVSGTPVNMRITAILEHTVTLT